MHKGDQPWGKVHLSRVIFEVFVTVTPYLRFSLDLVSRTPLGKIKLIYPSQKFREHFEITRF